MKQQLTKLEGPTLELTENIAKEIDSEVDSFELDNTITSLDAQILQDSINSLYSVQDTDMEIIDVINEVCHSTSKDSLRRLLSNSSTAHIGRAQSYVDDDDHEELFEEYTAGFCNDEEWHIKI